MKATFRNRLSMATMMLLAAVAFGLSACATPGEYAPAAYPADYGYGDAYPGYVGAYPDWWLGGWGYWGHGWGHWDHARDHRAWSHGTWGPGFPHGHPGFAGHGGFGGHGGAGHAGGVGHGGFGGGGMGGHGGGGHGR
jgi:hypothetical protein